MFISDFMEKTILIPEKIEVKVDNFKVFVSGEKGKLERDFYSPLFRKEIKIQKSGNVIKISSDNEDRKVKAMTGTIGSHIRNMINGVTNGYKYKLKIVYMHFPITVKVTGSEIVISNFLGEKLPRKADIVGDCKVEIKEDEITVSGINKEDVGQTSLNIERATRIPARDRRVFQDGCFIVERE